MIATPRVLAPMILELRRRASGLSRGRVSVGGFDLPYLHGGRGEPVVLLHGFSDSKDSFVDVARRLVARHRVVMPDLPGCGEATQPLDRTWRLTTFVDAMADAFDALGLSRFHLVGNSLGGAVAAEYALRHPERLRSLTLVCAAGVKMPEPSELQRRIEDGHNPFAVSSREEYREFVGFVLARVPVIPGFVQRYMADEFIRRADLNRKMLADLVEEDIDLTARLPNIGVPTLTLWGDRDRLIDPSAGRVCHAAIPGARLVILHGIGHCPQVEAPGRTAALLRAHFARAPL